MNHFGVPAMVCINKADLSPSQSFAIETYCAAEGIEVVGTLPYDNIVTESMVQGQPVTAYQPEGAMARALQEMWQKVSAQLED